MPRKQVGVAAIKKDKAAAEKFKVKTAELQESSFQAMSCQMETFRQKLEEFARTHKDEIKKDPEFRKHFQVSISMYTTAHHKIQNQNKLRLSTRLRFFHLYLIIQEMCASIGVDPLASSKGFWSEMLGFGDFYYELGVQIIEVCMATSHKTGGLMELGELRERLVRSRGGSKRQNSQVKYTHTY